MSRQETKRLFEDALANDELLAQLQGKSLEDGAEVARGLGYDVTAEELAAELDEYRGAQGEVPQELSEEELDSVAGGGLYGDLEVAPDGHDMGCFIPWHGKSWSHEHDTWCRRSYYCYMHWDGCVERGRTNQ